MAVELKLRKADRVYRPSDIIDGHIIVTTPSTISHQGIKLDLSGSVTLQPSLKSVGILESLYTSVKPVQLLSKIIQIESIGRINAGTNEVPFRLALDASQEGFGGSLLDSYHGAHISIQYMLTAEITRGHMLKSLYGSLEIIVESSRGKISRSPSQSQFVYFYITQDTQNHPLLPSLRSGGFRVSGKVMTHCFLSEPLVGELTVEHSAVPVSSIDLSLLRTESINLNGRMDSATTEVQSTQVADGDVCHGLSLAIYTILPRLLTCPTLHFGSFSLEFELAITVTFEADISRFYAPAELVTPKEWVAMQKLPLRLSH